VDVAQDTGPRPDHTVRGRASPHRGWLFRRPTFGGVAVALLFWWWSLDPSMLPRTWASQGAVSGLSAAIGYLLGTLAGAGIGAVLRRVGLEPSRRVRRLAWYGLGPVAVVVVAAGLALWPGWQNQPRDLVGMEHLSAAALLPMVAVTLVVFGVLLLLGRLVGHGIRLVNGLLARRLPRLLAHAITAAVFVVVAVVVTRDVVLDGFFDWVNDRLRQYDTTTALGVVAPTTASVSGSPASLVPWEMLGEYGRTFVATATTRAELRAFHGPGPRSWSRSGSTPGCGRPARPTSGPRSLSGSWSGPAPSGGRSLGVVTTTHTGWVDPNAASSLEYLHRGNTALVGLQYSYLPSWVSFLVDRDEAAEAGVALYRHVHRRWASLPPGDRPRLVIFGERLGSFGAEAAFHGPDGTASLANLVAGSDGALFSGPTASNHIWDQLTDGREPGSPVWRPVYDGGTKVQFANRPADLERPDDARRHPRVLYVHHPSDPVWNATVEAFWQRPEWTDRPQGYDVPAGRLLPDRHRPPGGGRPHRRVRRHLRVRAQLRHRLRDRLGGGGPPDE
jgi:uncharacterized membrane protein